MHCFFSLLSNNTSSIYSVSDKLTQGIEGFPLIRNCMPIVFTYLPFHSYIQRLAQILQSTIICFPKQTWFLSFILFTWKLMQCCLEAPHLLFFFYLCHIIFLVYISFRQIEFKLFGGQECAMAFFFFFVVLEFCILIVPDVKFRCAVIKTNKSTLHRLWCN